MVKRYPGKDHTSRACEYGNLVYFSAVSAPEQTSLYEQTAAILREYDSMFAELGLKKSAIVNAFVMLDTQDTEGFVYACGLPGQTQSGVLDCQRTRAC